MSTFQMSPVAGDSTPDAPLPSTRVGGSTLSIIDPYLAEVAITARIAQRIASVQRLYHATHDGCYDECRLKHALRRQRACEHDLNLYGIHLTPDGDLTPISKEP